MTMRTAQNFRSLDALRGISALLVFVAHFSQQFLNIDALGRLGGALELLGVIGVSIFFVLSGFLIHLGGLNEIKRSGSILWGQYFLRRSARIVPAYWLALVVYSSMSGSLESNMLTQANIATFLTHAFFVSSFWPGHFEAINAIFWTVVVECHFYLVYPLLLQLRRKFGVRNWIVLTMGLSLTFFVVASAISPVGPIRVMWQHTWLALLWQWMLGVMLAEYYQSAKTRVREAKIQLLRSFQGFIIPALFLGVLIDVPAIVLNYQRFIVPVLCFGLVAAALYSSIPMFRFSWIRSLGDVSYSIYLWHPLALAIAVGQNYMSDYLSFFVSLSISLTVAFLSYRFIEMPPLRIAKTVLRTTSQ